MANLVISGDSSGSVTLSAPAVSGTTVLTLPTTSGTLVTTGGGSTGSFTTLTSSGASSFATSSGNVGIGTASPTEKLDVNGTGNFNAASGTYVGFGFNGTNRGYIGTANAIISGGANTDLGIGSVANTVFGTGASFTERMRITSAGDVSIGSTGTDAKLFVSGNGTAKPVLWVSSNTAGDLSQPSVYIIKYDANSTTSQVFQRFYISAGGSASGQIVANGANQAAFASTSDQRLKENIVDLPSQLNNIAALRPVEFDYIESEGGGHQIGFIAQELQAVYPDSVGEREDGMLTISGWSKTEAILVKAIQEQQAIITQLQLDVAALKGAK